MIKWITLIIVASLLVFYSCDNSTSPPIASGKILPLSVGNNWEYKLLRYEASSGSHLVIKDSSVVQLKVAKYDTLENFAGYNFEHIPFFFFFTPGYILFENKDGGLYTSYEDNGPVSTNPVPPFIEKVFPYPTFVGDSSLFFGYHIKTAGLLKKVDVEAGTFYYNVYDFISNNQVVAKFWVAPNIGIIKCWQLWGDSQAEFNLTSFKLN